MNIVHIKSEIEIPRDVRNSKSGNMISSGETGLNLRTCASPKWENSRSQVRINDLWRK